MEDRLEEFKLRCIADELAENTIDKYEVNIKEFLEFMKGKEASKDNVIAYKDYLRSDKVNNGKGYALSTVNNKLISVNKYLEYMNMSDMRVSILKTQNRTLSDGLTDTDFERIRRMSVTKEKPQDTLILDMLRYTGIRISELQYFTVEAVKKGYMYIENKGKFRNVPIIKSLSKQALKYAKENGITTGSIILGRNNKPIHRNTVFKRLKWLSGQARVKKSKVYAHAIRHLFAKEWLKKNNNNILALADILGHESLETTRIYTRMNLNELRETMN